MQEAVSTGFRMANTRRPDAGPGAAAKVADVGHCSMCTTPADGVDPAWARRLGSPDLMFGVVAIVIAIVVPVAGSGEGGARS